MPNQSFSAVRKWLHTHQVTVCMLFAYIVFALLYGLLFIVPRTVGLTYGARQTCIPQVTVLPTLYKATNIEQFAVKSGKVLWEVKGVPVVTTETCVQPTKAPVKGSYTTGSSPYGSWLLQRRLAVAVPELPKATAVGLDKPVSATKPLNVQLSTKDAVHTYTLAAGDATAACAAVEATTALRCDIAALELAQGQGYSIELRRSFDKSAAATVLKAAITTLTATTVTDSSIKDGEVVYARPTELQVTTDKPLKQAKATLREEGSDTDISLEVAVNDTAIILKLAAELPREKKYILTITDVEATDGSSLAEPYTISFTTSGGPKVTGVNVGRSGVALGARIVVTFDQELSGAQDITKIATISGATAAITRTGNQVIYTLQGVGTCAPFTLTIGKGMLSKYDIEANTSWSYGSRTICHTTSVYGSSAKGRALVAYHFGNSGPVTMYVGAIHGNEPSASGIMKAWIDDLEANPSLYAGKRVVVVPTINPDGVAAGTRANSRGVDLNRNFPTANWTSDSQNSNGTGSGGSEPLSEPEAKALASFTTSIRPRLLLSYHAVGSLVTGDPGGYSAGYAAKYASMVGYRDTTYSTGGGFEYDITGAYEDWTYSKQGIPSMVIELGSYTYYNFPHHRAAMRAMLD